MTHKKNEKQNKQLQPKKSKFNRYGRVVVDVILFVLCAMSIFHVLYYNYMLKYGDCDYTICQLKKTSYENRGGGHLPELYYVFEFYVNNKRYQSEEYPPDDYDKDFKIGDCYMLKYNVENPEICKMDWNSPASIEEFESIEDEYMFGNHEDKE